VSPATDVAPQQVRCTCAILAELQSARTDFKRGAPPYRAILRGSVGSSIIGF
jgi:hypothetical protein